MKARNKLIEHTYVVEGRGQFPLDMLRRDSSEIFSIGYVHLVEERGQTRRIKIKTTYNRPDYWFPLDARWRSFGWKVVEHNGVSVDLSPMDALTKAEKEGRAVAESTDPVRNPYKPLSDEWFAWRKGFLLQLKLHCDDLEDRE